MSACFSWAAATCHTGPTGPLKTHLNPLLQQPMQDVIQTGVSAADRTMKAQLVGELRTMLTHKVGAHRLWVALRWTWLC